MVFSIVMYSALVSVSVLRCLRSCRHIIIIIIIIIIRDYHKTYIIVTKCY